MLSRFSHVQLFATLGTVAHRASLSTEFSRQEYWSGLPCPPPGDLPNPGIKPSSPTLEADSLLAEPQGKPNTRLPHIFSLYLNLLHHSLPLNQSFTSQLSPHFLMETSPTHHQCRSNHQLICFLSILNFPFIKSTLLVCMLNHVRLFVTPWAGACQVQLSTEFSRQEYWSGLPFPPPVDLPDPGIKLGSPVSLPLNHLGIP